MTRSSPTREGYGTCPEICDHPDQPGEPCPPKFLDGSLKPTTIDQARIEEVIATRGCHGLRILHVGAGNSSLARRFAAQARDIIAITLSPNEKDLADSLGLPNYRVHIANKYSVRLAGVLDGRFDLIVDNNLASFACCQFHFRTMLATYAAALVPGGAILTDQRGMDWSAADPRWKLTFEDLVALSAAFPFHASKVTETVYQLVRLP